MRAIWRRFFRTRSRRTSGWFERWAKRNLTRFPEDFLFQLTAREFSDLRSRSVISNTGRGGRRYLPQVFTEHGGCSDRPELAGAKSCPPFEGAREGGRIGESFQKGRLVHRDLLSVHIVERHLVAQVVQHLLEGRIFRLQQEKKRVAVEPHLAGDRIDVCVAGVQDRHQ